MNKKASSFPCVHIVSEPGDFTRYDYLVFKVGDCFYFNKYLSTFAFPEYLYTYQIDGILTVDKCQELIDKSPYLEKVNPWTLLECIDTMRTLDTLIKKS